MELPFYKYQGTGNDFVMIDNREGFFPKDNVELVTFLCDRKFGIGADGLILLEQCDNADFGMAYYNSDGNESTMCGNGGRCLVAFAKALGIVGEKALFNAVDGMHHATIVDDQVSLQMRDVTAIAEKQKAVFLDTGSPHHVQLVPRLKDIDVVKEGAKLRYGIYGEKGCNINFVNQISHTMFEVRTYERGVENETLSCGTGVTAVAIAMHYLGKTKERNICITTLGGNLAVAFECDGTDYTEVYLKGPAKFVFKGKIKCG